MKCPICEDKKMKSCVYDLGGSTTLMSCPSYYDEDGEYHDHDSNWNHHQFRCSLGHKWSESWQNPCPNPKCDWGKGEEVTHTTHIQNQEEITDKNVLELVKFGFDLEGITTASDTTITIEEKMEDLEQGDLVGTLHHVEAFLDGFPGNSVVEKAMNAKNLVERYRTALKAIAVEGATGPSCVGTAKAALDETEEEKNRRWADDMRDGF